MKRLIAGMLLAGLVVVPVLGRAADAPPAVMSDIAAKSLAQAESAYQQGLALKATAQQAADQAVANLDKAQTDFKLAQASGDKEKIKAAHAALVKAQAVSADKARVLSKVSALADRLKVILDKAREAAAAFASAKNPADARKALNDLERLAHSTTGVLASIETAMKPRPRVEIIGVTIPPTTTSTTTPSPTQVGQIRG